MASNVNFFGLFVILCAFLVHLEARPQDSAPSTEKSTWHKIKDGVEHGWNVAYDEVHCGFHKVKDLVQQHDHQEGSDPCKDKPYQQTTTTTTSTTTTPQTVDLVVEDIVPITTLRPF